ncbi:cytadherence high molecular weight protein 2-like [Xenia sp. Carnegie-2017]|uniref:cytadherence high molecular weight protein 2-like n=1 Tax=Xenia sp. Carnegie-2017 TaxID=2897299 RepID=UPI001F03E280|nr:cytadherence high molecular weight protein 2-like [Xenia sp. Carnegie-2017]
MKGKIPETLLSLTKLNEEIKKRVTSLQSQMEELQKKAKKAFEAGQENVLKNIEQQLEMIRTQLKVAKQQTLELKKKIQETFSDIQLKAKKVGGEAMKHVTLLRKKTEEAVEKAKRHYTIMKNNLTKNFQNAMMKFRQAKREAQEQLEKLHKMAKEMKTGMGEQMEKYIETLNTTVNDMKDNFFEQMKTLKEISANYTDILKDKVNDYRTTANNLTTKMKENMDEFHANVMKHMQSMQKKADQHVKKMFEKAKDLKTTLKTRAQKTATEMQKNLDALMKQYYIALATAMGMQKDAEENLRKVMERMSNGSQVIFQKAYEIAVKNVENSKKYMNEVQSYFVKLLSKLLFKETGGHLTKITPQIQSLKKKKLAYLRMRKKLRSFFSASGGN